MKDRLHAEHAIKILNQMDAAGFVGAFDERAAVRKWAETALASQPSGPKETSVGDLRAKLESLRDWMDEQMKGRPWTAGSHFEQAHKRLTAIIEGKD